MENEDEKHLLHQEYWKYKINGGEEKGEFCLILLIRAQK